MFMADYLSPVLNKALEEFCDRFSEKFQSLIEDSIYELSDYEPANQMTEYYFP